MHNHSKHSSEQFLAVFIFLEKEHDCEIEKKNDQVLLADNNNLYVSQ